MDHFHKIFVLAGIGLLLTLLLYVRQPWGRVARRFVGAAFLVFFALAGIGLLVVLPSLPFLLVPNFGGDREYTHLTYEDFKSFFGGAGLDPVCATDISYRCHSTIDSYDVWIQMRIASDAYGPLLARMSATMKDVHFASNGGEAVGPVKEFSDQKAAPPVNWPGPEVEPPAWWNLPHEGPALLCTRWERQMEASPYSRHAKGWYWLYDRRAGTLSIWEWSRQHFDLGWEPNPGKAAPKEVQP